MRYWPLAAYIAVIFAANWAVVTLGPVTVPGTALIAPAGVFFAGLAFTLRDLTQDSLGRRWTYAAIILGASLSGLLSGPLALASAVAFLFSETADLAVYTPFRKRRWLAAVTASNLVGLVLDSLLFLWLAFGSFEYLAGQIVGKLEMTVLAVALLWGRRALLSRHPPADLA